MSFKIQLRRGAKADLPSLDTGELGFTEDTKEIYVGHPEGNVKIAVEDKEDLRNELVQTNAQLAQTMQNINARGVNVEGLNIQSVLDNHKEVVIPEGVFKTSNLRYNTDLHLVGVNKFTSRLLQTENAIDPLLSRKNTARGKITIQNLTIDGNKTNQINRLSALVLNAEEVNIINCRFINTVKHAIDIDVSKIARIIGCTFEGMAEHTGVLGGTSMAISITGSGEIIVKDCYFENNAPSVEGRASGGVFVSGTSPSVTIKDNVFKGIGQYSNGNFIGCIDLYTNGEKAIVENNKFYNYRYVPLKLQNSGDVICRGNIVDGSINAQAGQGLVYQPAERGSTPTKYNALIKDNIIKNTLGGMGMTINGQSTTYTKNIQIEGNILENVGVGIQCRFISSGLIIEGNILQSCSGRGLEFESVSGRIIVEKNIVDGCTDGIFGRVGVTQGKFLIVENEVKNNSNLGLSVRSFDSVVLIGNEFNGVTSIDMATGTRASLVNNIANTQIGIGQVGITDYNELGNSWNPTISYLSAIPTTGNYKRGDIVYNTMPIAGAYVGWLCITAGSPGTWKGFGTIQA